MNERPVARLPMQLSTDNGRGPTRHSQRCLQRKRLLSGMCCAVHPPLDSLTVWPHLKSEHDVDSHAQGRGCTRQGHALVQAGQERPSMVVDSAQQARCSGPVLPSSTWVLVPVRKTLQDKRASPGG